MKWDSHYPTILGFQDLHGFVSFSDFFPRGATYLEVSALFQQLREQCLILFHYDQRGDSYSTRQIHVLELRLVDIHVSLAHCGGPLCFS